MCTSLGHARRPAHAQPSLSQPLLMKQVCCHMRGIPMLYLLWAIPPVQQSTCPVVRPDCCRFVVACFVCWHLVFF